MTAAESKTLRPLGSISSRLAANLAIKFSAASGTLRQWAEILGRVDDEAPASQRLHQWVIEAARLADEAATDAERLANMLMAPRTTRRMRRTIEQRIAVLQGQHAVRMYGIRGGQTGGR